MRQEEFQQFADLWRHLSEVSAGNQTPSQGAISFAYELLSHLSLGEVSAAMIQHGKQSKFAPTPAEIVALCKKHRGVNMRELARLALELNSAQALPNQNNQSLASTCDDRLTLEAVAGVFQQFECIYGALWLDRLGDAERAMKILALWSHHLADLKPSDLDRGLKACITSGDKFPPTLPVFYKHCTHREEYRASARREFR